MSEEIISPSDEVRIVNAFKYWYETNTEKGVTSIPDYICKGLLDLYNKEKEKNKEGYKQLQIDTAEEVLKWKYKYHLLSRKIGVVSEDEINKKYISKDKIREKIKELESIEPSDDDYNFEVQNDIHSKIDILKELLEEVE